MIKNICND